MLEQVVLLQHIQSFSMKKILCCSLFFFPTVFLFPQNHDHYWPLGYGSFTSDTTFGRTVLDFNEDPPLIYREDRELNFYGTMASY